MLKTCSFIQDRKYFPSNVSVLLCCRENVLFFSITHPCTRLEYSQAEEKLTFRHGDVPHVEHLHLVSSDCWTDVMFADVLSAPLTFWWPERRLRFDRPPFMHIFIISSVYLVLSSSSSNSVCVYCLFPPSLVLTVKSGSPQCCMSPSRLMIKRFLLHCSQ